MRVPNLYKLTLSLPGNIRENSTTSFFDCKLRKLFVIAPIQTKTADEEEVVEVFEDKPAAQPSEEVAAKHPEPAPATQ